VHRTHLQVGKLYEDLGQVIKKTTASAVAAAASPVVNGHATASSKVVPAVAPVKLVEIVDNTTSMDENETPLVSSCGEEEKPSEIDILLSDN